MKTKLSFVLLSILLLGCRAILGNNEVKPVQEKQAKKYLKKLGVNENSLYKLDYDCAVNQIKKKTSRDTSHFLFPVQNVLYKNDTIVSWLKVCDGKEALKWETFPPKSYSDLNKNYTIDREKECITDFDGNPIQLKQSDYTFFIYFIKQGGLVAGPYLKNFIQKSTRGIKKYNEGKDIQIVYVNSNPPKDSVDFGGK